MSAITLYFECRNEIAPLNYGVISNSEKLILLEDRVHVLRPSYSP